MPPATRGSAAFIASCSGCHASRDGFDLAFFGFADTDIVRRAKRHVSQETAEDIAAYIHTLTVSSVGENYRLFQPRGVPAASDGEFWRATFGAPPNTWPASLTVDRLRSMNARDVLIPFPLPVWSSEADDDDWMPDVPLASTVLDAEGGAVRKAVAAYYASPSDASLLAAVNTFRRIVRPTDGPSAALCAGNAGFQAQAYDCFQAMRWMSTLTAVHFSRRAPETIPVDVVRLWWETGEAAVSSVFVGKNSGPTHARVVRTAGWLSMAFSFAPLEFVDAGAYQGQFLQQAGFTHYALFVELYRMVNDGPINAPGARDPAAEYQRIRDGSLAVGRAPNALKYQAAVFVLQYLIGRLDAGETYSATAREAISNTMRFAFDGQLSEATGADDVLRAREAQLRAEFETKLQAAFR